MTRLVRLNEVQYAETEHQVAGLMAQGFHEEALAAPTEENPSDPAPNPEAGNPDQNPAPNPEPPPKPSGKKGGKG